MHCWDNVFERITLYYAHAFGETYSARVSHRNQHKVIIFCAKRFLLVIAKPIQSLFSLLIALVIQMLELFLTSIIIY